MYDNSKNGMKSTRSILLYKVKKWASISTSTSTFVMCQVQIRVPFWLIKYKYEYEYGRSTSTSTSTSRHVLECTGVQVLYSPLDG